MLGEIGHSVARMLLGARLRKLRESRGIHSEDAAAQAGVARATLWRMEKGDLRCRYKPGDMEVLGRLYGADQPTTDTLVQLAKATRGHSWAGAYRDLLTPAQETYLDLEAYATHIRCYTTCLLPELLQTADYATALIRASRLLRTYDADKHTRVRMRRQEILRRDPQPARFEFLIDEGALHRAVGVPSVMTAQLRALADRADLPNVSVRVIPHRAGMYPSLETGPFTILDFPSDTKFGVLPTIVHPTQSGEILLLDRTSDTACHEERWDNARAYALDEHGTHQLVTDTIDQIPVP